MRLTSELVQQSTAVLICVGDQTLVLQNLSIPAIENLESARDGFDTLDLSNNVITTVEDTFPPFPRVTTMHLGGNRIARITGRLAQSLPNLRTLVLTGNRIATVADLNLVELRRLRRL
ncbi:Probable U2 small nuclear ribonucleoprotein A' [Chondrus crispus]|uniref:Probable U2 small nuclear ribonucleoprotein A n=1 Tax=Chondrus crispus TaxID=2769 RepID=R7QNC1_CHOCR|nr:Probable U2 small nuclear ribonucleoprotein A' [Chondrus crispus]CDF39594.1 Probable U2 small nuclear ribonucleoprotein A' [Chondrus crispus]|eukprot:XP_005709888.1 Probable U2 small nuclear ribonucleoprotein A' [Chondrus crispus]